MRVDFKERFLISFWHAAILFIFAYGALLGVAYALNNVFDVAKLWAILWGICACIVTLVSNCFYIISGRPREKGIPVGLGPILVVAVIVGLFFSVAFAMREFREDFLKQESVRSEIASARARIGDLENQEKQIRVKAEDLSRRNVDGDPVVSPFLGYHQRASVDFNKAEEEWEHICVPKRICVPYLSPARRERLNDLKEKLEAAKRNLEAARLQVRTRIDLAVAELDKKEQELAEAKGELKRIERPEFRPHAFTDYAFREMKFSIIFMPLYFILHMFPILLSKDGARERAKMKREARNGSMGTGRDQMVPDPSVALNGSK